MGGIISSIFGGSQSMPEMPKVESAPAPAEAVEPEAKAVREEEQRRIRSRRAFAGTLLSGAGQSGLNNTLLGRNGSQ